jgi:hypothetical protein
MTKQIQIQKIISIVMIFTLLVELTACYSTRNISTSEIMVSDKYIIHSKNSAYFVDSVAISKGILTSRMDFSKKNYSNSKRINIYLSSDSLLKITNDHISLPLSCISKIQEKVPDPAKTKTLTFVLVVTGVGIGVGIVVMAVGIIRILTSISTFGSGSSNNSTGCFGNW